MLLRAVEKCLGSSPRRLVTSLFPLCGRELMRRCRRHFERASLDPTSVHPCPAEPDASIVALRGYRLFKILKTRLKGGLPADFGPAFRSRQQATLPFDERRIEGLSPVFRAIRKHSFSSVGHPQNPPKRYLQSLRAAECHSSSASFRKLVGHPVNPSKYGQPHAVAGGKYAPCISKGIQCLDSVTHLRVFSRSYTHTHEACLRPKALGALVSRRFKWSQCWRAASEKVFVTRRSNAQFFPTMGVVLKAVSFTYARSHLPLGIIAILLGRHTVAHTQDRSFFHQSSPSSFVLSALFSFFELFVIIARSLYLWLLFMPAFVTAPVANLFGGRFRQSWFHLVHHTLECAGAAFIKWGQWAATRPDLFPRDLCAELAKLHANAPVHKFSHTVEMVECAFGRRLSDIFVDFEEKPVASGSIAQVHKATLQNAGAFGKQKGPMTVAVKVRHPGVTDVIRRDFIIMNWAANVSTLIPGLKWLRLDESVRQFAVFMLTQVDLAREAAHLSRFLYNFRSSKDVSFPIPVYPLVHPAVLVESYEHGESVSNFIELPEKSYVNRKLARIGTHTFLKMLLDDNFIHADMHPGNILVRLQRQTTHEETKKRKASMSRPQPHLVFLDVGLTAELSQKDRCNLLEFFKAVALRDGQTAAQCALEFSSNQSCPDPAAFIKELDKSFKFWGSREADVIHPGECMQELLEQVRRHRVNVDGNVCTVMVTIMVLEGWQRKLDPEFSIMQSLQKLLFKQDWAESLAYTINGIMAP